MFPINPYHRDLKKPTFIFFAKGAEIADKTEAERAPEKAEEKPKTSKEWIKHFKDKHNPDTWSAKLDKMFETDIKLSSEVKERMKKDSMARYESKYNELLRGIRKLEDDHDEVVEEIVEKAEEERELMGNAIKSLKRLAKARPELEKVSPKAEKTTFAHKIPIFGKPLEAGIPIFSWPTYSTKYREYVKFQNKISTKFSDFTDALHKQYFNMEWQKEELPEKEYDDDYIPLANRFKDGMELYQKNQLAYIFNQEAAKDPEWLKQELNGLRDQLEERYERYANKDGFIDLAELEKLEHESKKYVDIMRDVRSGKSAEEIAGKVEYKEIFSRDNWIEATKMFTLQLVRDAMNNGSEAAFIEEVQKMTGKKEITDFDDAANEFEDIMEERAKAGVKVTIEAIEKFNKAVNGGRAEILSLSHVSPKSIHPMVYDERDLLMGGITNPEKASKDEYAVVQFMKANREKRENILNDPEDRNDLFKAIKNIKKYHEKKYNNEYKKSLPKKTSELTSEDNPNKKPHEQDKIARLLAIITLAKEAKWIIENLDKSPTYKGKGLKVALADVKADTVEPKNILEKMEFRHVNKLHSTKYRSAVSLGGFNFKDIGIGAAKALIVLTVFANLMQARKQKKLFTPEVAKNPILLGSVLGWIGLNKVEDGSFKSKPEHSKLNKLSKKVGRSKLRQFINTKEEFAVMKHISDNNSAGAIRRLLDSAEKKKRPKISKMDLRRLISDDNIFDNLPDTGNDRMRYLFYKDFMASRPNVRTDLRPNCEEWV